VSDKKIKHLRNSARIWVCDKTEAVESALCELRLSIVDVSKEEFLNLQGLYDKYKKSIN
jgi:hypothetical protein